MAMGSTATASQEARALTTSMGAALGAEPDLFEQIGATAPWTRFALCLFGGAENTDPSRQALSRFDPGLICGESPLTPLVVDHLRRAAAPDELAASLLAVSLDGDRSAEDRGDAIAGWAALGIGEGSPAPALGGLHGDDPLWVAVRERVSWRLGRSLELVAEILAGVSPGELVEAFDDGEDPRAERALPALGALGAPSSGRIETPADHLIDYLEGAVSGADGSALAAVLAAVHRAPSATIAARAGWALDRCGPRAAPELGEALTNLAGLPDRLAFLRCRLVTRIASSAVAGDHGEEAASLVLDVAGAERQGALGALEALMQSGLDLGLDVALLKGDERGESDRRVPPELAEALGAIRRHLLASASARLPTRGEDGASYPATRGLLRLAAGQDEEGPRSGAVESIERIADPHSRVRAFELARDLGLDVGALEGLVSDWIEAVAFVPDRVLAQARLARVLGGEVATDLLVAALTPVPEIEPEVERAELLDAVRGVARDHAGAESRVESLWQDAVASLRSSPLRARARGRLAGELLDREQSRPGEPTDRLAASRRDVQNRSAALDVDQMQAALQGDVDQIADALLAAAEGGADARHALAVALDVLAPAVQERGPDWLAALARIEASPELAGRARAVGWELTPLRRIGSASRERAFALAVDVLAGLPEDLRFLDDALAARTVVADSDLALQWLARFASRADAGELGERVVDQLAGETTSKAYATLWAAWRAGGEGGEYAAREALDAVIALPPFPADPWLRARALLAAPRGRPAHEELIGALEQIDEPAALVDAVRSAAPRIPEADLSEDRRRRWDDLGRRALEGAIAMEDPDDRLGALALLGGALGPGVAGEQAAQLAAAVEDSESPLLPWMEERAGSRGARNPVAWAALTLGAIAHDGLAVLAADEGAGAHA